MAQKAPRNALKRVKKVDKKKKCKQFRIDTSSLNRKNHITLSDAIKFDLTSFRQLPPQKLL